MFVIGAARTHLGPIVNSGQPTSRVGTRPQWRQPTDDGDDDDDAEVVVCFLLAPDERQVHKGARARPTGRQVYCHLSPLVVVVIIIIIVLVASTFAAAAAAEDVMELSFISG